MAERAIDLRAGDVRLICGTIFCAPDRGQGLGYRHAEQAAAMAHTQLHWYQNRFEDGELRLVRTASDLPGRVEILAFAVVRSLRDVVNRSGMWCRPGAGEGSNGEQR